MSLERKLNRLEFDCETLEQRRLLTVLLELTAANDIIVTGDDADSEVNMLISSGPFEVTGDDVVIESDPDFDIDEVRDIRISMGNGSDTLNIRSGNDLQFRDIHIDQRGENQNSFTEVNLLRINLRDLRIEGGEGEFRVSADELHARDIRATNRMEDLSAYSRLFISDSDIRDCHWNGPGESNSSLDFNNSTARNLRLQFGDGGGSAKIENATIEGSLVVRGDAAQIENEHVLDIEISEVAAVDFRGGEANDILRMEGATVTGQLRFVGNDGEDQVEIERTIVHGNATFLLGDGDDAIGDLDESETRSTFDQNLKIDLGDGNNAVAFGFSLGIVDVGGRLSVLGGDGSDEVRLVSESESTVNWGSFRVQLGGSSDRLQLAGIQINGTSRIDTGSGGDIVFLGDYRDTPTMPSPVMFGGGVRLSTRSGEDYVELNTILVNHSSRIDMGSGSDFVFWESVIGTTPDMSIRLGRGDDILNMQFASIIDVVNPLTLDGGSGEDMLFLHRDATFDDEQARNFEQVQALS